MSKDLQGKVSRMQLVLYGLWERLHVSQGAIREAIFRVTLARQVRTPYA